MNYKIEMNDPKITNDLAVESTITGIENSIRLKALLDILISQNLITEEKYKSELKQATNELLTKIKENNLKIGDYETIIKNDLLK